MTPATLANHGVAAWFGSELVTWLVGFSFIATGLWILRPDRAADGEAVAGTTLGMLLANLPAVPIGEAAAARLPLRWLRVSAAALLMLMGGLALAGAAGPFS